MKNDDKDDNECDKDDKDDDKVKNDDKDDKGNDDDAALH